jgi:hypothetical protein
MVLTTNDILKRWGRVLHDEDLGVAAGLTLGAPRTRTPRWSTLRITHHGSSIAEVATSFGVTDFPRVDSM